MRLYTWALSITLCKCYFITRTVHVLLFCTMTNKCTIISQIITLVHVWTLSCHPQGACNQYICHVIGNVLIIMTNKCTVISRIITLLPVSTLSCHPQGACNKYLAKLHQYFKMQILVIQFAIKMFHIGFMQVFML
jgi:hypothetical protein